ncbi:DnaJ domain-containing protein [Flammula alnicola]|nr:DnaJ domain-containing protein [Flammula alnicola]
MEPHTVLGVPKDASDDQIRAAYKNMAMKWHPDRQPHNREEATAKFVEINAANRALLRNLRRARRAGQTTKPSTPSNSSPSSPESTSTSLPDSFNESTRSSSSQSNHPSQDSKSSDHPSLRKQSRSTNCRPDRYTSEYTPKPVPRRSTFDQDPDRVVETLRPERAILRGAGADPSKKWVHVVDMTLEEIYHGKTFYFRIVRYTRSGKKRIVPVDVHVPAGTRSGTEIVLRDIGNELKDGTRQDIGFVVKEQEHSRFTRIRDDLLMEVRLPWLDNLNTKEGEVYLRSVDGKDYTFKIDYFHDRLLSGTAILPGAGLPHRDGLGRGRIVVRSVLVQFIIHSMKAESLIPRYRWQISTPLSSRWDAIKATLGFKGTG